MILKLMEKFAENRLLNADNFRLRTVWGQVLPQDQARLVDNERVLVETGIHSRRKAMDEVGVKDPEAEFRHWIEEQKEVSEIQNSNLKSQK